MRKLALPALAACALLAATAPVAPARTAHIASKTSKQISHLNGLLAGVQTNIKQMLDVNAGQQAALLRDDTSIASLGASVQAILSNVPAIVSGLQALKDGLTAVGVGLTSLSTAVQDPTTGLVGLNHARPQFGAFNGPDGAILGGTGQVTGASGPSTAAAHPATGTYIVDFGNDVSLRFLQVTTFPAANAPYGQAVDCATNSTASATCHALGDPVTPNPNHVLVTIEGAVACTATPCGTVAPSNSSFEVAAISG
jgi:hypothetical protein